MIRWRTCVTQATGQGTVNTGPCLPLSSLPFANRAPLIDAGR